MSKFHRADIEALNARAQARLDPPNSTQSIENFVYLLRRTGNDGPISANAHGPIHDLGVFQQ